MAIAHLCIQCGFDLARIRAQRDPHYHLPLVVCPRCAHACVRRMHPLQRAWRTFLRMDRAIWLLFWHAALMLLLIVLNVSVVVLLAQNAASPTEWYWIQRVTLGYSFVFQIGTGMWLTVGFAHLRARWVWPAWIAIIGVLSNMDFIVYEIHRAIGSTDGPDMPDDMAGLFLFRIVTLAGAMAVAALGIPLGHGVRRSYRIHRRQRWRKRRVRMRKLRIAA